MATAIIIYILLLIVFLIISSLILRHTVKFSYLSPRFRYIVAVFGIISVIVIIFSVFLLFKMQPNSSTGFDSGPTIPSSTGNLNF